MSFASGYAQGMLMKQQMDVENQKLNMAKTNQMLDQFNKNREYKIAQEQLGIQQSELQMRQSEYKTKMSEVQHQKDIDKGLGTALQEGGYTAAIEYLKTADPQKAIIYHSAKLSLDKQIMENETMKVTAPLEQQKAMYESYGLMGKMGAGIERMPTPEDKQRAWNLARPMISKIWPGAPAEYNADAQTAMKLAMAQGTPANILFDAQAGVQKFQSRIMKANSDLQAAVRSGNESLIKDAKLNVESEQNKLVVAQSNDTAQKLRIAKTQLQIKGIVQKDIDSYSKPFLDSMEAFTPVIETLQVLEKDPMNSNARARLRYATARMAERAGPLTADDLTATSGAAGYTTYSTNIKSWFEGKNVALSNMEVTQTREMLKVYMDNAYKRQAIREKLFEDNLSRNVDGETVNMEGIRKPSEVYKHAWEKAKETQMDSQVISKLPKQMQAQAQDALEKAGGDQTKRAQVMQKIQAFLQQAVGAPNGQ